MTYSKRAVESAISIATEKLGYQKLRPRQKEVVQVFLQGLDVFVSLPTGSGKSLCYCMLPKVFDCLRKSETKSTQSLVVVVSPLISLMKDQVRAMEARNMSAVYCGDADKDGEMEGRICNGHYQLIFMSPEAALTDMRWRDMFSSPIFQERLVALIVDEAHCVKKWGDNFRKAFSEIGDVRSLVPETVRLMALTATASKGTRRSVCKTLGMCKPAIISEPPNRINIKFILHANVGTLEESFDPLVQELRHRRSTMDRVIIYCRTYEACSMVYLYFKASLGAESTEPVGTFDLARFRLVDMFCACTTSAVKNTILESLCKPGSVLRVIVATIAFGLGLDCPNVRRVIHWGPSGDIEEYMQETGRAGRDGMPSQAILYKVKMPGVEVDTSMKEYCDNKDICRRELLLNHFDATYKGAESSSLEIDDCQCCDVCALSCKCVICK